MMHSVLADLGTNPNKETFLEDRSMIFRGSNYTQVLSLRSQAASTTQAKWTPQQFPNGAGHKVAMEVGGKYF